MDKQIDKATRKRGSRMALVTLAAPIAAAAAVAMGAALPRAALAQQPWPSKPITMVVPFPPGGPTDLVARVLAQQVGQQLGQTVIVDNRPGANGNIGNALVAKAAPDRSEEHTSELQSHLNLVCRLLLEKKKKTMTQTH